MLPKLTDEQRKAIQDCQGRPVKVQDDRTQKTYVLVSRDDFQQIVEDVFRRELKIGFDEADSGIIDNWDVDELLNAAHSRRELSGNSAGAV